MNTNKRTTKRTQRGVKRTQRGVKRTQRGVKRTQKRYKKRIKKTNKRGGWRRKRSDINCFLATVWKDAIHLRSQFHPYNLVFFNDIFSIYNLIVYSNAYRNFIGITDEEWTSYETKFRAFLDMLEKQIDMTSKKEKFLEENRVFMDRLTEENLSNASMVYGSKVLYPRSPQEPDFDQLGSYFAIGESSTEARWHYNGELDDIHISMRIRGFFINKREYEIRQRFSVVVTLLNQNGNLQAETSEDKNILKTVINFPKYIYNEKKAQSIKSIFHQSDFKRSVHTAFKNKLADENMKIELELTPETKSRLKEAYEVQGEGERLSYIKKLREKQWENYYLLKKALFKWKDTFCGVKGIFKTGNRAERFINMLKEWSIDINDTNLIYCKMEEIKEQI